MAQEVVVPVRLDRASYDIKIRRRLLQDVGRGEKGGRAAGFVKPSCGRGDGVGLQGGRGWTYGSGNAG